MELCSNEEQLRAAYPVMKQLRTHLTEDEYLEKVKQCQSEANYQLYAYKNEQGQVCACCGVMPMPTLYYDRCLWVCELVVDEACRSQGIGAKVLEQLTDIAEAGGYNEIALSSGLQRSDAHRFYEERAGFQKVSYSFKKDL